MKISNVKVQRNCAHWQWTGDCDSAKYGYKIGGSRLFDSEEEAWADVVLAQMPEVQATVYIHGKPFRLTMEPRDFLREGKEAGGYAYVAFRPMSEDEAQQTGEQ